MLRSRAWAQVLDASASEGRLQCIRATLKELNQRAKLAAAVDASGAACEVCGGGGYIEDVMCLTLLVKKWFVAAHLVFI